MSRILMLSTFLPPERTGSAIIVGNLLKSANKGELLGAGCCPPGTPRQFEFEGARIWRIGTTISRPARMLTLIWFLELPLYVLRTVRLIKTQQCTAVIVVYPMGRHLAAGCLAAQWAGVPFFPYFHNTWIENRKGFFSPFRRRVQRWIFRHAAHVFVMSDGLKELFARNYPDCSFSSLVHTFCDPIPAYAPPPSFRTPCRLAIQGSIGDACLEATVRIYKAVCSREDLLLTYITRTTENRLREHGIWGANTRCDNVAPEDVVKRLAEEDILLLPHGFTGSFAPEEYQTIFPTRTIECLLSRRPIILHAPADCFLTRFFREHQCGEIVDEPNGQKVLDCVDALRANPARCAELVRNALQAARLFHCETVWNDLRHTLEHYIGGRAKTP